MEKKAAVIGAGIGGLAAGLRLRHLGFQVTIFESSGKAGGKINEFRHNGFRFDMGPSLFTLPELVDELFGLFGKKPEDYIRYDKLDVITKYFYEDGLILNAYSNVNKLAEEIGSKTNVPPEATKKYLRDAATTYDLTADNFIFKPFNSETLKSKKFWKAALRIRKLNVTKTMHELNKKYFGDARVVQLFDRYATYNGSNPYQTPGTLSVISHLEHNLGAFFPEKGMYQIVESIYRLAQEQGIEFRFNEKVQEIRTAKGKAIGVSTPEGSYDFDLVVSDADIFTVYKKLLPDKDVPAIQRKQERSSSALILYWGISKEHPELEMHNILFSDDYKKEFEQLFNAKELPEDPTVYIFISSKQVPADAPQGHENWFVMINAPADAGQDWEQEIAAARTRIIRKIRRVLKTDIENHILFERQLDPVMIERKTGSYKGALYGNSSNNKFAAFLRHKNYSSGIKNLYFVGGSVHPGGGIPLCLSSAKMMSELIDKTSTS